MSAIHGAKIAIGGKGGVGKTTVCAILAQLFAEGGYDVLAIDADPDVNLASAFGIPSEDSPEPLIEALEAGVRIFCAEARQASGKMLNYRSLS